jgi:hypothetical protein
VTVAGQSAPGGGIAVTGSDFILNNGIHDVVFRHIRFRACNEGPTVDSQSKNIGVQSHDSDQTLRNRRVFVRQGRLVGFVGMIGVHKGGVFPENSRCFFAKDAIHQERTPP